MDKTQKTIKALQKYLRPKIGNEKYKEQFLIIDLLKTHLTLYYQSQEHIKTNGIAFVNKYGVWQKNPCVTIMQTSIKAITALLDKLYLTLEKDDVEDDETADEFIQRLIN